MLNQPELEYTKLRMFISCENLKDMDYFSKSDPIIHIDTKLSWQRNWVFFGKTEMIENNLNPDFATSFTLDFHFEEQRYLCFRVYDIDDND